MPPTVISPPTAITEANVLWGIAAPLARILLPHAAAKTEEEIIAFDLAPGPPPLVKFKQEVIDSAIAKDGRLIHEFLVRPEFIFRYDFLTVAEAQKWGKLWNYHMAKYEIYMRPHNDATLTLEWQVKPTPGSLFEMGYFANKYIGHTLELSFTAVYPDSNINLQTSQIRFRPTHS